MSNPNDSGVSSEAPHWKKNLERVMTELAPGFQEIVKLAIGKIERDLVSANARAEQAKRCDDITMVAFDKLADKCDVLGVINRQLIKHAEAAEQRLREVEAALRCLYDETADYITINHLGPVHHNRSMQMARDALAPERTVAGQESDQQRIQRIIGDPRDCCTFAPPSPLLPGLERAAEIAQRAWPVGTAAEAIRAEISRLKGEGSDHE